MGKAEKIALVILLAFGIVFGLIFRISLTDKTQGTRLDGFFAAEFPAVENLREDGSNARDYFEEYANSIQEELDAAEFLITCVPTGDVKYDAGCVTTMVRVTSVIRGDGIAAGDVIRVYRGGWGVNYFTGEDRVDLGFSTFLLGGSEWLLFLSERMDVNEKRFGRVYAIPDLSILPAFCLEERAKVTIKPDGRDNSTYVPLEPLRGNEFLAASDETMEGMREYKRLIMERHAPEIGADRDAKE